MAESLESRVLLSGFNPNDTGYGNLPVASQTLARSDVSIFDINQAGGAQRDSVTVSGIQALNGVLKLRFGPTLSLSAGNSMQIMSVTGAGTLSGAFVAVDGLAGPDGNAAAGLDMVLIQSPRQLVLVATSRPTSDFTIVADSDADVSRLVAFYGAGTPVDPAVPGVISAHGQRIDGALSFSGGSDGDGAFVSIGLGPRTSAPARDGRVVVVNQVGGDVFSVFGSGNFKVRPRSTDDTLRGLRLDGDVSETGYAIGNSSTRVGSNVAGTIGPVSLANVRPTLDSLRFFDQTMTFNAGLRADSVKLAFTSGQATPGEDNPGGVTAEAGNPRGTIGVSTTYDAGTMALGNAAGSGAFAFSADLFSLEVPGFLTGSATVINISYDPSGPATQQIATLTSLSIEIPRLHTTFAVDPVGDTPGLTIYGDGFAMASGTFTYDTTGRGTGDFLDFIQISAGLHIRNPSIALGGLELRFSGSSVNTFNLASFGVGAGGLKFETGTSFVQVDMTDLSVTVGLDPSSHAPNSLTFSVANVTVSLGSLITLEGNQIQINTNPGPAENYLSVGSLSGHIDLTRFFGSASPISIGASIRNFAIDSSGHFVPGTGSVGERFSVGADLSIGDAAMLLGDSGGPDEAPVDPANPSPGFAASFDIYWQDVLAQPENFIMLMSFAFQGSIGPLSVHGSVTDMIFDSNRIRAHQNPVVSVRSIAGGFSGTAFGASIHGDLIAGAITLSASGDYLSTDDVIEDPSQVSKASLYFGAKGGFEIGGKGVDLLFGFSTEGFSQAYFKANVPILLDPNTGLTISGFRGGITLGATPLPTPNDPALLRSSIFTPTLNLTDEQWAAQLAAITLNQLGGGGGFVTTLDSLDSLDDAVDAGVTLPGELTEALTNAGFSVSSVTAEGTVTVLISNDAWLVNIRNQKFIIARNSQDHFDIFALGTSAFVIDSDAMLGGLSDGATAGDVTADVPDTDDDGNLLYSQNLVGLFRRRGIDVPAGSVIEEQIAGKKWKVSTPDAEYFIRLVGDTAGDYAYVVSGGMNAGFSTPATTIRIEAGFTMYSQYASESSVNIEADAIIDIAGKFLISGSMNFGQTDSGGMESNPLAIKARIFFDVSQLNAGTGTILFLGDVNIADNQAAAITVYGRLTFGFFIRSGDPMTPDTLVDNAFLTAHTTDIDHDGRLTIKDLVTDGDTGNDPQYFKLELSGSESQGIAVIDSEGIPALGSLPAEKFRLGGKAITPLESGRSVYGYAALSFDFANHQIDFEFDANLSIEGVIEANSIVSAAGKFQLKFGEHADGSLFFQHFYGAAKLNATTDSIDVLNLAGIHGDFNAIFKINISTAEQTVHLQLPGRDAEDFVLQPLSLGFFVSTTLIFEPPVVGGFLHQEITGAFAFEISSRGFELFILGTTPVPLPLVGTAAGLKADILGVLQIKRFENGPGADDDTFGIAGRLNLLLRTPASGSKYFDFNASLSLYINSTGLTQSYALPADFARTLTENPASISPGVRALLNIDETGDSPSVSIDIPAGAPRRGYGTRNPDNSVNLGTDPANGGYLVLLANGVLRIADTLSIDAQMRLKIGASEFSFAIAGSVTLAPFSGIVAAGEVTIRDIDPMSPDPIDPNDPLDLEAPFRDQHFDPRVWGSLNLAGSFSLGELTLFVGASVDLNTDSSPHMVTHYYNPANGQIYSVNDLNAPMTSIPQGTFSIYAGGYLRWSSLDIVKGDFTMTINSAGLMIQADAQLNIAPLASVSVTGDLQLAAPNSTTGDPAGVVANLNINTAFGYGPFTFSGTSTIQFNTFGDTRLGVPAHTLLVYVDGYLRVGSVFSLHGNFTFLNNDQKLSISGSADLDLYVTQVHVNVDAAIFKGDHSGLVLDVGLSVNTSFGGIFTIDMGGRLRLNTRDVATTLRPGLQQIPAATSIPYIKAELSGNMRFLDIVTVAGAVAFETVDDTAWQSGWSSPKRHWMISGYLSANVDFFVGGASLAIGRATRCDGGAVRDAVFYDSGEFLVDISASARLGPSSFYIEGTGYLTASYLRNAAGTRVLSICGAAAITAHVDIEIPPIDFGPFGSTPPATIANESFNIASVTINYDGNTGELSVTPCVVGICHTFSLKTIKIPNTERPVVPYLAGGPESTYHARTANDGPVGVWDQDAWTGGTLFLNTGSRARFRNLSNSVIQEDYVIEAVDPNDTDGIQTLRVYAFGKVQIFENVTSIDGRFGAGVDSIIIKPGVHVPVTIDGGEDADTITCESDRIITIFGMDGNDKILAAGADGSRIDGGDGNDAITWFAGNNAHVTIIGGAGTADTFSAIFPDLVTGSVLTPVNDRIRMRKVLTTEQFRLSRVDGAGMDIEYVSVESGFEGLSISAGAGSDDIQIDDFDLGLNAMYLNVSYYKTLRTTPTQLGGITVGAPVYEDDTAPDTVRIFGGSGQDTFTLSTPSDSSGTAIQVTRSGSRAFTFLIYHAVAGTGETLRIDAGGGADTINASAVGANLAAMTFIGGAGDDNITGTPFNDTIYGDDVAGGTGVDILRGGPGNDTIDAGGGGTAANPQQLFGDAGDDLLIGGPGVDILHGGADNDTIDSGDGNNFLFGDEGNDALNGGSGDDEFTGGLGTDTYSDTGGNDRFIEARAGGDLMISDDTFIVGVLSASSRSRTADAFDSASEVENLRSIFQFGDIRTDAGQNVIVVGDYNGQVTIAGLARNVARQFHGNLDLRAGADSDRYVITIFGTAGSLINILDSAGAADSMTIYGSDDSSVTDTILVRAGFVAALAPTGSGASRVFDRVNYTREGTTLEAGMTINTLAGNDTIVTDDNSIRATINAGDGNDLIQVGQVFGSTRSTPRVAMGDEFNTTEVDLSPSSMPGTVSGYVSNGASNLLAVKGGQGNDSFFVYRNIAAIDLDGEAGDDTFTIRSFALAGSAIGNTRVVGGSGRNAIEYAQNANVDVDGGDGIDSVRILGTQFADTYTIDETGIIGGGLNVTLHFVESLELHTGDGNDTIYVVASVPNMRVVVFGGAGSDHFYITGVAPNSPNRPGTLDRLVTPVLLEGGPGDVSIFGLPNALLLPGETDTQLPPGAGSQSDVELAGDVDTLDIVASDATANLIGEHRAATWPDGTPTGRAVHNLFGLGMGGDLTQETSTGGPTVTTPGGISYSRMEIFDLRLGSGNDALTVTSVSAGTTTIFRGNAGDDSFIVSAAAVPNALLAIFGDSSARSISDAYGNDTINASASGVTGLFYGGPGNDTILGGSAADRIAGGPGNDTLGGGAGDDLILGDSGFELNRVSRITTIYSWDDLRTRGPLPFALVGSDIINPGNGRDIVFGDHGAITLVGGIENQLAEAGRVAIARTANATLGGNDTISARADVNAAFSGANWPTIADGDDLVFGGAGSDAITGGSGNEVLFGDVGIVYWNIDADPSDMDRIEIDLPAIGAPDSIFAGAGNDLVLGGADADTIGGDSGNDLVFGDFGLITGEINLAALPIATPAFAFTSVYTTAAFPGAADTIAGDTGDDILIGGQGADAISGGADNDDIIGGHNVAGGYDGADRIDGGSGNDTIAGDNAQVLRLPGTLSTRFRVLNAATIYSCDLTLNITGAANADPHAVAARQITLLDAASSTSQNLFGADLIAGGSGDDAIFGQLGDDQIRGDGSLNTAAANALPQASASPSNDGDDYIEGNAGSDQIWGDLGQDDLIGGNSDLFGLTSADQRSDGIDTIFGGTGIAIARNDPGDTSATGHARDADVIIGDNGRVVRLVGATGFFLAFNYDNYSPALRIVPRGVQLIDYTPDGNAANDIGGADTIRGEAGDDVIYGASGNDTIYGDGQDDDLYGGAGVDWLFGGTGNDGILGDDGLLLTARNGTAEPLNGIGAAPAESLNSLGNIIFTTTFAAGELMKYARLVPFNIGGDDVIFGGLGNDFIHAGDGMDAVSGAEAQSSFYEIGLQAIRPFLVYTPSLRRFTVFDPGTGLRKIPNFFLNFDAYTGSGANITRIDDGRDFIFGDHGNDWLVGGTNQDRIFGGMGDDVLNADDNLDTINGLNSSADAAPFAEADIAFGGGGLDRLIGNTTGDRLIDWVDQFNQYLTPFTATAPTVVRNPTTQLIATLRDFGRGSGADQFLVEPNGELGLVQITDPEWIDQIARPNLTAPTGPTFVDIVEDTGPGRHGKRPGAGFELPATSPDVAIISDFIR